jgi:hypothetical protein
VRWIEPDACSFLLKQHQRGTATASYTYAGDANHSGSSDSKNFTIDLAARRQCQLPGERDLRWFSADALHVSVTGAVD